MTEDILQAIKKKAEDIYYFDNPDYLTDEEVDVKIKQREAYTSGCIKGIELMKGFVERVFADDNPFMKHNGRWIQTCGNSTSWTTDQLLSLYIKQLNNEKQ